MQARQATEPRPPKVQIPAMTASPSSRAFPIFSMPRLRTRTSSPASDSGSESNLSRVHSSHGSMRRQVLQRLWSREVRRFDRTNSLSPPLQRATRSRRGWRQMETNSPDVCIECQKIDAMQCNRNGPEMAAIKRAKFSATLSAPDAIETERKTIRDEMRQSETTTASIMTEDSVMTTTNRSSSTNQTSDEMKNINDAVHLLNQMNGNFVSSSIDGNDNDVTMATDSNTFLIEMEGDQIHITTNESLTMQTVTGDTVAKRSDETIDEIATVTTATTETSTTYDRINENENNKNRNSNENDAQSKAISPSSRQNLRHLHDQSSLDSFISQILVDSLNNIIVVEGKVHETASNDDNLSAATAIESDERSEMDLHLRNIYFPHYRSDESGSDYSTKYSNASGIELPTNLVISVISGSSYPMDGGEMIVHRLTQMPHNDSMEVQPSSASGDNETGRVNGDDDDDSASLVDSLDEPFDGVEDENGNNEIVERPKPEAFFVPIEASNECDEDTKERSFELAMPERLKERLQRRQEEISRRKDDELKRRQKQIQKIIETQNDNVQASIEACEENGKKVTKNERKKNVTKKMNRNLRAEVGQLKSYTIDAQGNLMYKQPLRKSRNDAGKSTSSTSTSSSVKKATPTAKKIVAEKATATTTAPSKSRAIVAVRRTTAPKQATTVGNKGKASRNDDVQKMTLYHQPTDDTVTPDTECGPRRMYQKTEIRDGGKRIEILEIVECANSSDSVGIAQQLPSSSSSKSSKIPVPVPPAKRVNCNGNRTNGNYRQSKHGQRDAANATTTKNFAKSLQQMASNSKVDQIIADLLIEALNSSTDIGIEFVTASQDTSSPAAFLTSSDGKRVNLVATRRANGKRSAHSGTKYQQIFDSIPEEKSSLSIESTNDEPSMASDLMSSSMVSTAQDANGNESNESHVVVTASGKAAIESDQDKPEAWFGYFGRTHNDSPIDAAMIDEGIFKVLSQSTVVV